MRQAQCPQQIVNAKPIHRNQGVYLLIKGNRTIVDRNFSYGLYASSNTGHEDTPSRSDTPPLSPGFGQRFRRSCQISRISNVIRLAPLDTIPVVCFVLARWRVSGYYLAYISDGLVRPTVMLNRRVPKHLDKPGFDEGVEQFSLDSVPLFWATKASSTPTTDSMSVFEYNGTIRDSKLAAFKLLKYRTRASPFNCFSVLPALEIMAEAFRLAGFWTKHATKSTKCNRHIIFYKSGFSNQAYCHSKRRLKYRPFARRARFGLTFDLSTY